MAVLVREAASWAVLVLMSARLLTEPDQVSTQQLLVGAGCGAGLLALGWILWYAFTLYLVPYNRVKVSAKRAQRALRLPVNLTDNNVSESYRHQCQ